MGIAAACAAPLLAAPAHAQTSGPPATAGPSEGQVQAGTPTWQVIVLAVLLTLLVGGVIGNLFASKRRARATPSIYAIIDRRLRAEREQSPEA